MKTNLILGCSVLTLAVFSLQADTLRLRDGRIVTGTFQSATRNDISFRRDGGQTDRFDIGSVESIAFGSDGINSAGQNPNDRGRYNNDGRNTDRQAKAAITTIKVATIKTATIKTARITLISPIVPAPAMIVTTSAA